MPSITITCFDLEIVPEGWFEALRSGVSNALEELGEVAEMVTQVTIHFKPVMGSAQGQPTFTAYYSDPLGVKGEFEFFLNVTTGDLVLSEEDVRCDFYEEAKDRLSYRMREILEDSTGDINEVSRLLGVCQAL